mgnify:CR=1 FL=1
MTDYAITTMPPTESPEQLARDPFLAILPSDESISLRDVRRTFMSETDRGVPVFVVEYHGSERRQGEMPSRAVVIEDPLDIAALRAAISRVGVTIYPPTVAGSDADGDGKVGEP